MQFICKINKNILGKYKNRIITEDVILTQERLNNHILLYHVKDFEQLSPYLKDIIYNPDFVMEDNRHTNTLIFLKKIKAIEKAGRIVLKLAVDKDDLHDKNFIITLMRLNNRTWNQTIKNRGNTIFTQNIDKYE